MKELRSDTEICDIRQVNKTLASRKTCSQEQLKHLYTRANIVEQNLGPWAVRWYVNACFQKLQLGCRDDEHSTSLELLKDSEKIYLEQCLSTFISSMSTETQPSLDDAFLSPKTRRLIDFLLEEQKLDFSGLIFVQTRAEVAVLSQLLSTHPQVKDFYTISTFVGASNTANRKANISEIIDVRSQVDTLDDLRFGRRNLVVTTNALEEGIDVPACNMVICFDKPANLKSVIQRRGRARQSKSTFAIMLADDEDPSVATSWKQLEEHMRQLYQDDMRRLQKLDESEGDDEGDQVFVVEKTGAKLFGSDAVSHLYHFCATLPTRQYSNPAPVFSFEDESKGMIPQMLRSKVILPISVDVSVRVSRSQFAWATEKAAKRDAAFQAYMQLYDAGLISDNLLPIRAYEEAIEQAKTEVEKIASLIKVKGQINPWHLVARQWQGIESLSGVRSFDVLLRWDGKDATTIMQMLVPCFLPAIPQITIFWDAYTTFEVTIQPSILQFSRSTHMGSAIQSTMLLLSSVFRSRIATGKTDFVAFFIPLEAKDQIRWAQQLAGAITGSKLNQVDVSALSLFKLGLIRDVTQNGVPYILRGFQNGNLRPGDAKFRSADAEDNEPGLFLQVSRFPKRTDFLHPVHTLEQKEAKRTYTTLLRPEDCEIDKLPVSYAYFAAIVPAFLHRVGVRMAAAHLCDTLLAPVQFQNLDLVVTAITASAAQEPSNYQRQEYLGDSILKFLTSLTLMSEHLRWHEGILSRAKDHIVSNASLARAALAVGLDSFIQTKAFTGSKWRPLYVSDLLDAPAGEPRELSTKTLADVIEALIGAAAIDGGFKKAIAILKLCLPRVPWGGVEERNQTLFSSAQQASIIYPHEFSQLEELVGYTFNVTSLPLEALTDSSFIGSNASTSYDRLEFLGDVCLDIIVSTTSFKHEPPVPTHGLHLIRTAVVNANFLAFLCLTLSIFVPRKNITTASKHDIQVSETSVPKHIWSFLRHASPSIRKAQQDCKNRYEELRTPILESLEHGSYIPWALLARVDAPKFFSDIIESVIGAMYIDSHGSLAACEAFLEKLGIMRYLRRLLQGGVALYHPKEELGQLADTERVRYEVFKEDEGDDREKRLGCKIFVGEREVVKVGDGVSVLEVETRGAEEAVRALKGERGGSIF
ncbi:MAG: hypothetical protein Q9181_001029 [Wetmoreana brouardii]